jgi:hypothetical protein
MYSYTRIYTHILICDGEFDNSALKNYLLGIHSYIYIYVYIYMYICLFIHTHICMNINLLYLLAPKECNRQGLLSQPYSYMYVCM